MTLDRLSTLNHTTTIHSAHHHPSLQHTTEIHMSNHNHSHGHHACGDHKTIRRQAAPAPAPAPASGSSGPSLSSSNVTGAPTLVSTDAILPVLSDEDVAKARVKRVSTVYEALEEFFVQHENRVKTYARFKAAYREFEAKRDQEDYDARCERITGVFKSISLTIRMLMKRLEEDFERTDLVQIMNQLQMLEKRKLQLTVHHQLLKINYVIVMENPYDSVYVDTDREIRKNQAAVIEGLIELVEMLQEERDKAKDAIDCAAVSDSLTVPVSTE
jgi:DNA repair REX1-B